jgi:hypothetical protein
VPTTRGSDLPEGEPAKESYSSRVYLSVESFLGDNSCHVKVKEIDM